MSKITESARGEECQIRINGICNGNPETVVWCHCNALAAGKGVGLKSLTEAGAYGCFTCHAVYDRRMLPPKGWTRQDVEMAFAEGHYRSLVILKRKGLI